MMDLAELRINRTPVTPNSKCDGCVHYDGNAQAKGGACEVGQAPAMCGTGTEPKYGYAALVDLSPDEVDDLATPCLVGAPGAMNEHGEIEKMVMMQRVCLGDEDLTIAQRIYGTLQSIAQKSIGYAQGEVNMFAGAELATQRALAGPQNVIVTVAKSLHDLHLSPRKRRKYGVSDVLEFLKSRGMPVSDDDLFVCKSRFGPTRQVQVPTMAQAATHLREHNASGPGAAPKVKPVAQPSATPAPDLSKYTSPRPKGAPSDKPGWHPRSKDPTQPIAMAKSDAALHSFKAGDNVMHEGRPGIVNRAHPTNPNVGVRFGGKSGKVVPHDELTHAPVSKSLPSVRKLESADPFVKRH